MFIYVQQTCLCFHACIQGHIIHVCEKNPLFPMKSLKNICHILKRDHKDSENAIQKFTNLQYQKILSISYKSLTLFLNLILFSLVFFFFLSSH